MRPDVNSNLANSFPCWFDSVTEIGSINSGLQFIKSCFLWIYLLPIFSQLTINCVPNGKSLLGFYLAKGYKNFSPSTLKFLINGIFWKSSTDFGINEQGGQIHLLNLISEKAKNLQVWWKTSPKGFSASKCDVGNWIFSNS